MSDRLAIGNTTNPPMDRVGSYGASGSGIGMGTYSKRKGIKPKLGQYTLDDGIDAYRDISLQARLYEESVAYPNLADNAFVVEQATTAVKGALKDVYNVMEFLRNKWLIMYRLYRGETLAQFQYGRDSMHSPEPFKAVETQHPRIMRALFGNQRL